MAVDAAVTEVAEVAAVSATVAVVHGAAGAGAAVTGRRTQGAWGADERFCPIYIYVTNVSKRAEQSNRIPQTGTTAARPTHTTAPPQPSLARQRNRGETRRRKLPRYPRGRLYQLVHIAGQLVRRT